ncbi:MAG: zinc ribbon domain-containing protein [Lentisphaeria bacterium]|nr:zinc ribbon domain-containing protein [Lentisphaeria bacterium]
MDFCEECGSRISVDCRFCENCGTAIDMVNDKMNTDVVTAIDLFKSFNWQTTWLEAAELCNCSDHDLGIIITDERKLLDMIPVDKNSFNELILSYINNAKTRRVDYYYLDLSNNCINNLDSETALADIIRTLKQLVNVARPKYCFILGNENIVDFMVWENKSPDDDVNVFSDLPYASLNCNSPWEGQRYDFTEIMRVGRLTTYEGETFAQFERYFYNVMNTAEKVSSIIPYCLSAYEWKEESQHEFSTISESLIDTSPETTDNIVQQKFENNTNLFFFNLHGSDKTKFWYGQKNNKYPEALSPSALKNHSAAYFLGVEACYGANYANNISAENSILQMALQTKCLAFLGSSKIAYGTSEPEGSCADIVVGEFIRHISKGESAGDAYVYGLEKLFSDDDISDAEIKTFAEFALYGDPSVRAFPDIKNKCKFNKKTVKKSLFVPMPDVLNATRLSLTQINEKLEKQIDAFVSKIIPESILMNSTQKVYHMENKRYYQKVYISKKDDITNIAKVYFNGNGNVLKLLFSK